MKWLVSSSLQKCAVNLRFAKTLNVSIFQFLKGDIGVYMAVLSLFISNSGYEGYFLLHVNIVTYGVQEARCLTRKPHIRNE